MTSMDRSNYKDLKRERKNRSYFTALLSKMMVNHKAV